ncbi:hypothetical protein BT96DRAFT_1006647 [Gymnopus androsaceus JB14]|uniref:Uncharacterized protein n=1 Tax=Gymnopus androsaceus JB14 TaxID=1447944 RepID=A0A6A4GKR7_9AGAR|nr:hypothetical protein BT96DRAFT_1006647 [Gymnopus androsaceus JB14]
MSEILPAPLTNSPRSDIILLSSYLCGQQAVSSVPHPGDRDAELYNHVSTVLTTGNSRNPKASNVNAVIGKTNISSVEFLVFAKNARLREDGGTGVRNLRTQLRTAKRIEPTVEQDSGKSEPMGERVDVVADKMHGKELLEKWVEDKDSFTFGTHLKDLFNENLELKNHPIPKTNSGDPLIVKYPVNSNNTESWLRIIYKQWLELEEHLLVDKKKMETMKARKDTTKDVPKAKAIHAILKACTKFWQMLAKQYSLRNSTTLPADKADENNVAKSEDSEDSEDHDELNLPQKEVDSAQLYPNYAASHVMSAFKNVLGWQYTTTYVYAKASHFRGTLKISRFYYPHGLKPAVFHPKTVTDVLENKLKLESSIPYKTTRILSTTLNVKVQAEAALMSWITTLDEKESTCSIKWLIGVSKKSCRLCWELSSFLEEENRLVFQLPGTHSTFYPWISPPGISDTTLLKLQHVLLNACQSFKATHSRQSSTSSAKDDSLVIDSYNSSWGKAEIPMST